MRTKHRPHRTRPAVDIAGLNMRLSRPWDDGLPPVPAGFESIAAAADDQLIGVLATTVGYSDEI